MEYFIIIHQDTRKECPIKGVHLRTIRRYMENHSRKIYEILDNYLENIDYEKELKSSCRDKL